MKMHDREKNFAIVQKTKFDIFNISLVGIRVKPEF